MNFSYWEYKTWLSNIDFTIVGSGIVGLSCALALKKLHPKAKILVLERGMLPQGASTKNAGFACFGSISEVLSDLENHSEAEVVSLVQQRWQGIQSLRNTLGDKTLDFQNHGGHELFLREQKALYEKCLSKYKHVNQLLHAVFEGNAFALFENTFHFKNIQENYITNRFEGQLDTGKMMQGLLNLAQQNQIMILNGVNVEQFVEEENKVVVKTNHFELKTNKLFIATNAFAQSFMGDQVIPARAQVLITRPIHDLAIKGTFHFDEGYYYFRNIENRILFGGGRNLDFKGEETAEFGQSDKIQNELEKVLATCILPDVNFEIERRWSGIMGVGQKKHPIVKQLSNNVYCGVRLGGMGVAIGSSVGNDLARLVV